MADKALNVISICGSLRKGSYNRMVMNLLPGWTPANLKISEAPPFSEFPLYNADVQNSSGFPAPVQTLAKSAPPWRSLRSRSLIASAWICSRAPRPPG